MNKVLYVDFDGTLTTDRYWRSAAPDLHARIQALLFGDDKFMVNGWMRGVYTAEEINTYVARELDVSYEALWQLFVTDCNDMRVDQQLLDTLEFLEAQYVLVLITGNMDSFSRFTVPALGLDKYFDHISNSYYEEIHKTDREGKLFKYWAQRLGIPLEASILIDDQDECCELFAKLGGKACQTTSPEQTFKILQSLQ